MLEKQRFIGCTMVENEKVCLENRNRTCALLLKNGQIYYKSCTLTQKHTRNILNIQNNRLRKMRKS